MTTCLISLSGHHLIPGRSLPRPLNYIFTTALSAPLGWCNYIWHKAIQPRKSIITWNVLHGRVLSDQALQRRGFYLCSRCEYCHVDIETTMHLFFECREIHSFWDFLFHVFHLNCHSPSSLQDIFRDLVTLIVCNHTQALVFCLLQCNLVSMD